MASRFWVGGTGTWDTSDTTHWAATSGGAGGQSVPGASDTVTFDGSSGGGTVTAAATLTGVTSLTAGAFTGTLDFSANDPNFTVGTVSISGSGTRTINLGDGTWTISGVGAVWDATTTTNLTFSANASTLNFTGTSNARTLAMGGLTYSTINLAALPLGYAVSMGASFTTANLGLTAPITLTLTSSATYTISNQFTWAGTSSSSAILLNSSSTATAASIAAGAAGSTLSWAALRLVTFTTNAVSATNSFDLKGNNMNGGSISGPSGTAAAKVIGG
jgi:hypothetical protein